MSVQATPEVHSLLGEALAMHGQGRLQDAERLYRAALALAPEHHDALHLLGVLMGQRGDTGGAAELISRAIAADSSNPLAFYNRGNALRELKRYEEALSSYDSALALRRDYLGALTNRGVTLQDLKRPEDALQSYDRALALDPNSTTLLFNRANALRDLGRLAEALVAYASVLQRDPHHESAFNNRGSILMRLLRFEDALADFDRVLAFAPSYVEAIANRGNALTRLKRHGEAIAAYNAAIAMRPDFVAAYRARGTAFFDMGDYERAFADYDAAYRLDPDLAYLEGERLHTKMLIGDWSQLASDCERLREHVRQGKHASEPFPLLAISPSPGEQLRCAQIFAADRHPPSATPLWRGERYAHERIRIAYVSGEFRQQATAYLTADLFECHDRESYELYAISTAPGDGGPMRRRLEAAFEHFLDASHQSDSEIAAFIRREEIDILVNLNGYFGLDRTDLFAMRAAPVQVNYLGFPGTMGATYMDYIIADRVLIPEDARHHYSEKIIYLPDSYQPNDRKKATTDRIFTRAECGLPENGFVFCCFNNNHKLTPEFFDIWMRLLQRVDGSVLWLYEGNRVVKGHLQREAEKRGLSPERLVFAPTVSLAEHYARERLADLFLDTLPHNAHTTASDALWCGVPVVTCLGTSFAGRVAASLLTNIGLSGLITTSLEEYEALAFALARDPERLDEVKATLLRNRDTYPLFDTPRYTRHIEKAFRTMWERAEAGQPPASLAVEPIGP